MIIQVILIIGLAVSLFFFIQNRNTMRLRAGKKLLFILFVILGTFAILDPASLTKLANFVGVGRGTDLLLYLLVLAFAFVVLSIYLKFKDYEVRLTKLSRHIALIEAERANDREVS